MRIAFDNVNPGSSSGPNSFGRKLMSEMRKKGHEASVACERPDVQLSFINASRRFAPKLVLRLDGIYFNTRQAWESMNEPIRNSFLDADLVVYQSNFNKNLTEKYFGKPKQSVTIHNGTSIEEVSRIEKIQHPKLDGFEELWCCSSSWRPHKRLQANIEYFLQMRPRNSALVVLGDNPDHYCSDSSVIYVGKQPWETCISIYKRCKKFIHLAFLDHCPNVVVDARAAGCELIVASSGGTREIAGYNATVVSDVEWDMKPLDLYSPPPLDPTNFFVNKLESNIDIGMVTSKYIDALSSLLQDVK